MDTDNTPATPEQIKAIQHAAWQRRQFVLWIADKLEACEDKLIRKEAAKLLRELVS